MKMIHVSLGGMQYLSNLTDFERDSIKEDLTLDNPEYINAKAYGRCRYTNIPKYLMYYTEVNGDLIVPRGYEIKFKHKIVSNERVLTKGLYPTFKLELREAQREAFNAWRANTSRGTLILPTGVGKSILGCYIASVTKQRALVVVQKDDLVDGWMADFALCFGYKKGEHIGLIKGKKFKIGRYITIATIQTLTRMDEAKREELYDKFGLVIYDEMHHVTAKSYEIFRRFRNTYSVGLTATDEIKNGLREVLYWVVGGIGYRCSEEMSSEAIMPYIVKCRKTGLVYDPPEMYYYKNKVINAQQAEELREAGEGKHIRRKPLDPQELRAILRDEQFNYQVAKDIKREYLARKSCIAFLHEKEHIRYLRDILIAQGVPQSQIQLYYGDSKTPDSIMKEKAESKEVLITIATFSKATEGTNVKAWERAFLVTSINDIKNTKQAVGRIRRRKEGKADAIVYDYYHPKAKGLRGHIETRMKAYKETRANIVGYKSAKNKGLTRGFSALRK